MPSPDSRVLTAHVPVPLADRVDSLADRLERSRGWVMKEALAAWVEREERRFEQTLEALSDVSAERSVSHEEVKAWAASLKTDKPLPLPSCK